MSFSVNFFGDFMAKDFTPSVIDRDLRQIIDSAKFNVINFEAPIHSPSKPILKSGPSHSQWEYGPRWLEDNGFNVILLANNHIMDYGADGLLKTINAFKGAECLGAGIWKDAYKPTIIEYNDVKIAFLSCTHCEFGVLTDEYDHRDIAKFGSAWINHPTIDKIIVETKAKVDYLILLPHAGVEEVSQPLPEWRDRYKTFVDLGADAVIATHPHIIQSFEIYKEKPIYYSLGNFYFPKKKQKPDYWYKSLCVTMTVFHDGIRFHHTQICFGKENITLCNRLVDNKELEELNSVLNDNDEYMDFINVMACDYLKRYNALFYGSGYAPWITKEVIKQPRMFLSRLVNGNITHVMNNMRCESHRWTIIRALKLLNKIQ